MIYITRRERFNAAHRLNNASWSAEKNEAVFGKCNNPNYHGHNYNFTVMLTGEINPETGYVYDLKILSEIVHTYVIERLDHKNLNLDVKEFENLNPTAENIVVVIYKILRDKIENEFDLKIKLYETERNIVEYPV